mgnify:CR=1 FL=1|jgi:hypothetical protein|tara:strand:+ start:3105 stop:3482 length:378 start_codon:yes stop_codon:yes gene_type:complete
MEAKLVQWVLCDNELKELSSAYNSKTKIPKETKEKLSKEILEELDVSNKDKTELPTFNIPAMQTSISAQNNNSYESYTTKFYKECFSEYLGSEDKADELIKFMRQKRKVVKKGTLKRDILIPMGD